MKLLTSFCCEQMAEYDPKLLRQTNWFSEKLTAWKTANHANETKLSDVIAMLNQTLAMSGATDSKIADTDVYVPLLFGPSVNTVLPKSAQQDFKNAERGMKTWKDFKLFFELGGKKSGGDFVESSLLRQPSLQSS